MAAGSTLVKRVMVQLTADDADAEEKLDAITAKAEELGRLHPDLQVKIDTAAAAAKMKILRDELKAATDIPVDLDPDLKAASDRMDVVRDELSKLADRAEQIKIRPDDKETDLSLLNLKAKLAALSDKVADPKIRISGVARAEADLAAVNLDLDKLKAKADESDASGLLGKILMGRGSSDSGGFLGGLVKWLPFAGDALSSGVNSLGNIGAGGASDAEQVAGAAGDSGPEGAAAVGGTITAITYALPAIAAELTGVVSGFAAAGAGVGAFGALAYPTIKQITGAVGDTKAQLEKLPGPIQTAVGELKNLEGQYDGLAKKYAPEVTGLFSQVTGIASDYGPKILDALAKPVFPAVSGLFAGMDKELKSKGFGDWLKQFSGLEGPSIGAIGTGVGHLANNIGKLLTTLSAKDDVNAINIAFSAIDGVIIGFTGFVKGAMVAWDALSGAWKASVDGTREAGHDVASGFDEARHASASFAHGTAGYWDEARHSAATGAHDIADAFDIVRHGAAAYGHDAASSFDELRHNVATSVDETVGWVKSHWKEIASFLTDPVATAVFEIRTHLHEIAHEFDELRHDVSSIAAGTRHDIAADFDGLRHDMASSTDQGRHDVASAFDGARHDAAAAAGGLRHDVASAWDGVRHDAAAAADDVAISVDRLVSQVEQRGTRVLAWFEDLPGRILHYLTGLPGQMSGAGQSAISGLIHGIESEAASIPSVMKGLAGDVESYFTDPLKIFSPSRVMYEHGLAVPEGVALGIEAGTPRIRQAAAGMARAAGMALGSPGTAGGAAAAAAAANHVTIQITGDAALRQWLKKSIRVTGGQVQVVGA